MECPVCHGNNVIVQTSVVVVKKKRSFLWNLLMILITGGIWLIWMLIRKNQVEENRTIATCQDCGKTWEV